MTEIPQHIIKRFKELQTSFKNKREQYDVLADGDNTSEELEYFLDKIKLYREAYKRVFELAMSMRRTREPSVLSYLSNLDYEASLATKASNKQKFDTTCRYAPWFLGTSLSADYGTFTCDRCRSKFFHSPSTISLGTKEEYNCCCGNCTNLLVYSDHQETPYF